MMGRGGGGGRGVRGRGRSRREYSPRLEEKHSAYGRGDVGPSRHLWVGNLSPHMTESALSEHFYRFGDLESIIFVPGRSYAFVNYKKEEDAVLAIRALQGFVVAGMPLRIEFQKGDKSSSPLDGDYAQIRDEKLADAGEPFLQRDSRIYSPDNTKGSRSAEPSEVLWIGFPAFLHVDELVLRRAFSPFGEIEKITAFPGRTYAFVQYRSVVAACRAKEALQGKLFNNPRVSICFARREQAPFEQGRDLGNSSDHPNFKPNFQFDRDFEDSYGEFDMVSSRFFSDTEKMPRDADISGFGRKNFSGVDIAPIPNAYGNTRFQGLGSEPRISEDLYDNYRNSPQLDRFRQDVPSDRSRRGPYYEDNWDVEGDAFPLAKKIRIHGYPDKELPEYPYSDRERERSGPPKFLPGLSEHHISNRRFDPLATEHRGFPDHLKRSSPPGNEDLWRRSDDFDAGHGGVNKNVNKQEVLSPESHKPLKEEWKWEGTIAKGGTAVCRARCFPVGKVMDIMLPEFLDCTARTGLDMLSKHFYQASSSWVVFFVPQTDADIVLYNEFMHYLGEKQRAAVAKLGEKTTLFLVPPSDFSEQVLKVPGKMSISGVILKFQQASNLGTLHQPTESADPNVGQAYANKLTNTRDLKEDNSQIRHALPDYRPPPGQGVFNSSSEHIIPTSFPLPSKPPGIRPSTRLSLDKLPSSVSENRYDQFQYQKPSLHSNWAPKDIHTSNVHTGHLSSAMSDAHHSLDNPLEQEYPLPKPGSVQGMYSNQYSPGSPGNLLPVASQFHQQESKPEPPPPAALPSLHPEQLAKLAALVEQQKRLGKGPVFSSNENDQQPLSLEKAGAPTHTLAPPNPPASQFNQVHPLHQYPSNAPTVNQAGNIEQHGSQVSASGREEADGDPQKRLQATLQLAAALLQQIQQQSKD